MSTPPTTTGSTPVTIGSINGPATVVGDTSPGPVLYCQEFANDGFCLAWGPTPLSDTSVAVGKPPHLPNTGTGAVVGELGGLFFIVGVFATLMVRRGNGHHRRPSTK